MIKKHHVRAIVVLGTVSAAAAVADVGNRLSIPILSLANELPIWVSRAWPFVVKAAHSQRFQMEAMSAFVQSQRSWRKVNIIYQDDVGGASFKGTLPYLVAALQDDGVEVGELLALPPSPWHYSLSDKLERLRRRQCRVFIVHTDVNLGAAVFRKAKAMGMMESSEQSVWITTTDITNHVDTLDPTSISSMQGVIGLRTHFPHGQKKLKHFRSRFKPFSKARASKGKRYVEPGVPALQAHDAVWALALAVSLTGGQETSKETTADQIQGQILLNEILNCSFMGLTGEFKFVNGSLEPAYIFELVNVIRKDYEEIGYWTKGLGFSEGIGENRSHTTSPSILGPILWPGRSLDIPRGWVVPTEGNKLRIGVPLGNSHREFVNASYESPGANLTVTGFSADVFNATLSQLPYHLEYEFYAFNGTYDSLVQRVYSKVSIRYANCQVL